MSLIKRTPQQLRRLFPHQLNGLFYYSLLFLPLTFCLMDLALLLLKGSLDSLQNMRLVLVF